MKTLPFEFAIKHLLADFPPYVEAQSLNLHKFKLPDGREAIVQLSITTDDHELEWFGEDWEPK